MENEKEEDQRIFPTTAISEEKIIITKILKYTIHSLLSILGLFKKNPKPKLLSNIILLFKLINVE
ncbi:hypothetical protein ASE40_06815 [Flavobacterium sp. Root935]|nr:hypothetical protein ASE40_06815 [Flavobacterium sp. Root935]